MIVVPERDHTDLADLVSSGTDDTNTFLAHDEIAVRTVDHCLPAEFLSPDVVLSSISERSRMSVVLCKIPAIGSLDEVLFGRRRNRLCRLHVPRVECRGVANSNGFLGEILEQDIELSSLDSLRYLLQSILEIRKVLQGRDIDAISIVQLQIRSKL